MTRYIQNRVLASLVVVWGAATIVFFSIRAVPGDPALVILGPSATPDQIVSLRAAYGLDASLLTQYARFLQRLIVLDFGTSFRLAMPAAQAVGQALPATALLAMTSLAIAVICGLAFGIAAALRPGSLVDRIISTLSMTGQALPSFWIGLMLVLLLSRTFHLLPSGGDDSANAVIMPAVTLALPFTSVVVRLVRSGLLEVLGEPYLQTARAKGFGEWRVVGVHGVRNMLIPVVTVVGLELGSLLGGAVIVETVFAWPGLGRLLIDSIAARDYAVVEACTLVLVIGFVIVNLLVDLAYGWLDPRVRVAA